MATIRPFNGVRYVEREITKLICPPYDVISNEERSRLVKKSPRNMVNVELPVAAGGRDKYHNAAAIFKQWQHKGIMREDGIPSFYLYEQAFNDHGKKAVRTGFFASLKLENPHTGAVKPHEKTLAKPKADRLSLLRSVKANLSPIFGLFGDKKAVFAAVSSKVKRSAPDSTAKDNEGTVHKLWRIEDVASCKALMKLLAGQNVFIADGHHRYETAWNYSQEMAKKTGKQPDAEYNYVMTFLCPMQDKGLVIWPTHRVAALPAGLEANIEKNFNVLPGKAFDGLARRSLGAGGAAGMQPLKIVINGKASTLTVKNKNIVIKAMPDKCRAYQELGVSILHSLLFANVDPASITYVKDEKEAVALAKKTCRIAVIVPPTPMKAIEDIALAGQVMPQKSTYFFPKVATGIVLHKVQ
jgi:uncharacterized protein (DUF1015 family)